MKYPLCHLLLIAAVVLSTSCERGPKDTGFEIKALTDMVRPVGYEAYSSNPVFANGMTMQLPVEGTVHRDELIPTNSSENPIPYTAEVLARGKDVFQNYCLVCHGPAGDGDGPIIPKFPNPPAFTSNRVMTLTPQQIFDVISNGKGNMPGHASQIYAKDRWSVIYYVEFLQGKRK